MTGRGQPETMGYDPLRLAAFYDDYGDREWTRFHDGRTGQASLGIHLEYLRRYITPGQHVLDIGAGPGRFTIELARLGARVTVADLSPGQLARNRERLAEAGLEAQVAERVVADVTDLSHWPDATFDASLCYGGPLSYVLDRADAAVAELARVTRPGGLILASVMSLVGATLGNLGAVARLARECGPEMIRSVLATGNLPPELSDGHVAMHLFRWRELEALLTRHDLEVVAATAASIAPRAEEGLTAEEIAEVTRWQLDLATEPGALDAGGHILVVARTPADAGGKL